MSARRLGWVLAALVAGCSGNVRPIAPVAEVDLNRFMGDWYVIAHIPSRPERGAYNAIENYRLDEDGKIQTRFRFRDGGFDRPVETMHPVGTVEPGSNNAIWGMQFIWPIQAEYLIAWVDDSYNQTIVARSKRDYVWYMARTPQVSDQEYQQAVERIQALGYDITKLRRVPQSVRRP